MVSVMTPQKAQMTLASRVRERRLQMNLTQTGLSVRSGVPLATLRKFEQSGAISLESFVKLLVVLGMVDAVVQATKVPPSSFTTIDEVIELATAPKRKRGRRS